MCQETKRIARIATFEQRGRPKLVSRSARLPKQQFTTSKRESFTRVYLVLVRVCATQTHSCVYKTKKMRNVSFSAPSPAPTPALSLSCQMSVGEDTGQCGRVLACVAAHATRDAGLGEKRPNSLLQATGHELQRAGAPLQKIRTTMGHDKRGWNLQS